MDDPKFNLEGEAKPPIEREGGPQLVMATSVLAGRWMFRLAAAGVVFNALAAPLMRVVENSVLLTSLLMFIFAPLISGVLIGEVGALACWLVWGPGPFQRRLITYWGIGLLLGMAFSAGTMLTVGNLHPSSLYEFVYVICLLPTASLAAQLPLWPLRAYFGWRIEAGTNRDTSMSLQPLSILDILSGTAVVAVSLGLARLAARDQQNGYLWMSVAVLTLGTAIASAVLLLPAVGLVLRVKEAALGISLYFGYVFVSVIVLVGSFSRVGAPLAVILPTLLVSVVFAATVAAPLFVWRACGYRLVWPGDARRRSAS